MLVRFVVVIRRRRRRRSRRWIVTHFCSQLNAFEGDLVRYRPWRHYVARRVRPAVCCRWRCALMAPHSRQVDRSRLVVVLK